MSQHHRTLSARPWRRVRLAVIARDGGVCRVPDPHCCTIVATQVDHIVPLALGGARLDPANLRGACRNGNAVRLRQVPALDAGGHW